MAFRLILLTFLIVFQLKIYSQTTVSVGAVNDNTLYESLTGALSNGAGMHFFTGKTNNGDLRRGLVMFDVAAAVPANATIVSVDLKLNMSKSNTGTQTTNLHRVTTDWGEGASNASGDEGGGAASMTNDATWIHTFFSTSFWGSNGGDFNPASSASAAIGGLNQYTWASAQMVTDVQDMLDNPGNNFGWILIGNEVPNQTAKRFDTKENPTPANRPELVITYNPLPTAADLVINEVDYDQAGTDKAEFIEIRNNDANPVDLSFYELEFINGNGGGATVYKTVSLPNIMMGPGTYFVLCASSDSTNNCDTVISPSSNLIQNGAPDALALKFNGTVIVDAVSYEGNTAAPYTEGSGIGLEDLSANYQMGISRYPDGVDTDMNNVDLTYLCITPGLPNGPPEITFLPNDTIELCAGGSEVVTVSGGSMPQWYKNGAIIPGAVNPAYLVTGPGHYNVIATNGSCRDSTGPGLKVFPKQGPTVNLGNDTSVCDFYVVNAANPGATYQWSTGSTASFILVQQSGQYSVTVTQNGCSVSDTINVTVNATPNVDLGRDLEICDPVVMDVGNQGAQYLWSTGDTTQTIVTGPPGDYWVEVNVGGCLGSDTINVIYLPKPVVNLGNDTTVCDTVLLDAGNPDASYLWNTAILGRTLLVTASGQYSVTVTKDGCSSSDTINVTVTGTPQVELGPNIQSCDSITLDAGNTGASYMWSTGSMQQQITVTQSGTYSVTVTDGQCSATDSVIVNIAPAIIIDLGGDITSCDSTILTSAYPNASYMWSTGDTTQNITVFVSGIYSVTVSQNSCVDSDTINVAINSSPIVDLGEDTVICDQMILDAGVANAAYAWSTGDTTRTILVDRTDIYWVAVTANGCTSNDTVIVTVNITPFVDLGPDTSSCGPLLQDAGVVVEGYLWSTGDSVKQILVSASGIYSITVTQDGCSSVDTVQIAVLPVPDIEIIINNPGCDSVFARTNGNQIILWPDGSADSTYWHKTIGLTEFPAFYTNPGGCTGTDTVIFDVRESPVFDLGPDTTGCDSITLIVPLTGLNYAWTPTGETTQSITVNNNVPTTYTATVIDTSGCFGVDVISVTILTKPDAVFTVDSSGCPEFVFTDNSTGQITDWDWDFGNGDQGNMPDDTILYNGNGVYNVSLTASNQCGSDTATASINVDCIVGIEDRGLANYISVYPNPAKERFFVEAKDLNYGLMTVSVLDVNGKMILAREFTAMDFKEVDLNGLASGMYFIKIDLDGQYVIKPLILNE